ncbi:helix-turn-helix domain-containing protein [Microbacterium sp. H37-C3]|uniref:winged helix-turn-helix domain-containing protein n=1 Tax=Microbacterium sp. H37-C3 TaxID=3004354 RepID=UPI0022AF320C|nr:helix-turn-helix domain-containing protein [Microbacterium sp. H37-C3]MCZ4067820.1 helix-turn-helix domain-containing protein [Microbacterium sp. H37-C3]
MTSADSSASRLETAAAMRVLAHPTRLRLLGLLRENGPQTAAQLGEVVDEAPGTISYHLSKLASIDLIEPAEPRSADQRERWWQAAASETTWEPAEHLDDPAQRAASSALEKSIAQIYAARYSEYVDAMPTLPAEWVAAGATGDRTMRLTLDELTAMRSELESLMHRWQEASARHDDADETTAPVALVYQAYRRP